jgi:hypothetical protein
VQKKNIPLQNKKEEENMRVLISFLANILIISFLSIEVSSYTLFMRNSSYCIQGIAMNEKIIQTWRQSIWFLYKNNLGS